MQCDKHVWAGAGECPSCVDEVKCQLAAGREMMKAAALKHEALVEQYSMKAVRESVKQPTTLPGYEPLAKVLQAAMDQSSRGKGRERHATTGTPFLSQPICEIGRMVGVGYNIGQAMKKGQEAMRLPRDRAQAELLGGIVYLAAAYLLLGEVTDEPQR